MPCHEEVVQAYRKTGMGRSIDGRPTPLDGQFNHTVSNRQYTISKGVMERRQLDGAGKPVNELARAITYAIGSGNHAVTYVHQTSQGRLFELPVSWYRTLSGYAMSPGYDRADHFDFRREISEACLFCHSGGPSPAAIECGRCHGASASHLAKPGRGTILNPAKLPAARQLDMCLQCHLETSSSSFTDSVRQPGREVFSYKPGEPLSNYKQYFAPQTDQRFEINHAGYRLLQSTCFRESKGTMTCSTCHVPHTATIRKNACAQCHSKPHTDAECTGCHLPKRGAADAIHVSMTDHKIERRPKFSNPVREDLTLFPGAIAGFFGHSDALTLERANVRQPSVEALQRFVTASPKDAALWTALGNALIRAGRPRDAVPALQTALALNRRDTNAQTYLAVAHAVQGNPAKALEILKRAVADNPDHALAWINLGITEEALGNLPAARDAYDRAIVLQPDSADAVTRRKRLD